MAGSFFPVPPLEIRMLRSALALALGVLASGPARAQAPSASPYAPRGEQQGACQPRGASGFQGQHNGFYLNLMLGYGGLSSKGTIPQASGLDPLGGDFKVSGGGAAFGAALGGSVAPGSIIGVHVFGLSVPSPELTIGSLSGQGRDGSTYTLSGIGPTLVFYSMPSNVFLQLSPAITRLTLDSGTGLTANSDRGLGLYLALGTEWYLAEKWGLGLAGFTMFSSNKVEGTSLKTATFGAALSLTLN